MLLLPVAACLSIVVKFIPSVLRWILKYDAFTSMLVCQFNNVLPAFNLPVKLNKRTGTVVLGNKFLKIEILLLPSFGIAISASPSPSKSLAIAVKGKLLVAKFTLLPNEALLPDAYVF